MKLPDRPHIDQLKRQAKELLKAFRSGEPGAIAEVNAHYHGAHASTFALHDAQLVLARASGFESWPKLTAFVDGVTSRQLAEAVHSGDIPRVRSLLRLRPEIVNLEVAEDNEHRALHYAVLARMPRMVRLLMQHGADARKGIWPNREATSALTIAADRGYDEIVAIIRDEESQRGPKAVAQAPLTPLADAVRANRPDELLRHLDAGLDPDEPVRLNGTEPAIYSRGGPLHLCASTGRLEMATLLLKRGADPNAEVLAEGSVLFRAYASKESAMVQLIESYGGFLDAASAGFLCRTELAQQMLADEDAGQLRAGIVPAGAQLAETLLWSSCGGGDPEIVRMALARVDWPRDDHRWHWPLWQALTAERRGPQGGLACFRLLLQRGDPNVSTLGRTILHDVAASGKNISAEERLPFAAILLEAGAKLDRRDDLLKSTPLGWACRWGYLEMAKLLLECGADPVEADAEPWATPRAWAEKMGHQAVLAVLNANP